MAKVYGPLLSMGASGTVGKAITFLTWKGIAVARKWFSPENPNTALQQNVRKALSLALAYFQGTVSAPQKAAYEVGAAGQGMSGYNLYMKRALIAYNDQLGTAADPLSVTVAGDYPSDVFTWIEVT